MPRKMSTDLDAPMPVRWAKRRGGPGGGIESENLNSAWTTTSQRLFESTASGASPSGLAVAGPGANSAVGVGSPPTASIRRGVGAGRRGQGDLSIPSPGFRGSQTPEFDLRMKGF
jgi:hypothetical protein